VLKRFQDGIVRFGSKPDEIALNVGTHKASVRNRSWHPEALFTEHSRVDFTQGDRVSRAAKADAAIADTTFSPPIAQAFFKVMASQVRPGLTQPYNGTGLRQSAKVIRRQPAYSIRASDSRRRTHRPNVWLRSLLVSQNRKETLGIEGASMYAVLMMRRSRLANANNSFHFKYLQFVSQNVPYNKSAREIFRSGGCGSPGRRRV
jgi:hypothetical protein